MRLRNPVHRVSAAAGLAAGGMLGAHALTYALVAPDPGARDRLLAATGHGYLPAANFLAILAVLVTVGAIFLGRLTRPWSTPGWTQLGSRLAAFQVGAFLSVELLERLGSGAPLAGLLRGGLLVIGVSAQLLTAGAITALVRLVLRASDSVAAVLGRAAQPPTSRGRVLLSATLARPARPDLLLAFSRGPPPSR